ncbi:MAG TPA: hypothetical protein VL899_13105 [Alphaproteobacteria bacterium]|jgi:hypothetical protein|nr:hypothetical protein [Alphaproteobacteria bacterium]
MRMAIYAAAASALLAFAPALAQAQHAPATVKPPAATTGTAAIGVSPNMSNTQNLYQQNQQVLQGTQQDTVKSQQQMQILNQRNQQMMQSQPVPAQSRPH